MMMIKTFYFLVILGFLFSFGAQAQEAEKEMNLEDMLSMSFEDLMKMEVRVGNISGSSSMKLPLSVTTITKEEIELSNAQNLLHLIQLYVPGASYWRHGEGPMIGLRGITSDRNNKLLMVVNGIVVNQKAHNGVVTELEDWDMEDIQRIEIIRGPGSVTYGPGAIAGVINIVTKSAGDLEGFKATANYVSGYNNKTATVSYGFKGNKVSGYFHGGIAATEGLIPDGYAIYNNKIGARQDSATLDPAFAAPASTYMKDFNNQPQLKFLASLKFFDENTFTARYNKSGSTIGGYKDAQSKPLLGYDNNAAPIYGDYEDRAYQSSQQLLISLKNNHEFSGTNFSLESEVVYLGSDYIRTRFTTNTYGDMIRYNPDTRRNELVGKSVDVFNAANRYYDANSFDNPLNLNQNYSENTALAKTMGLYKFNEKYKIAAGAELSTSHFGTGWGDNAQDLRLGDAQNIINGDDSYSMGYDYYTSPFINPDGKEGVNYFYVGNGWNTSDLGFVAEANLAFHPLFNLIISGRADKNTYSDWLYSPRVAIVTEINKSNTVKLVVQQSNKTNTAEQMYIKNKKNEIQDVETLSNIELIYTTLIGNHSMFNISSYYNQQNAIGWSNTSIATLPVASVELGGVELDYRIQLPSFRGGINHAYTKQLDYKLKDNVRSSILSNSEFYVYDETGLLHNIGSGSDLVGIANNTTKLYLDKYFKDKTMVLHTELAAFWGFEGSKQAQYVAEELATYKAAGNVNQAVFESSVNDHNFFGNSYFWNATFSAKIYKGTTLMVGVQNILGGEAARIDDHISPLSYNYNPNPAANNNNGTYNNRSNVFYEPRTYSIKLTYTL